MPGARHSPAGDEAEETREPQIADDDHHAEKKGHRVEIDDARDVVDPNGADRQHETRADQRRAGASDTEAGQAPDRDDEVGHDEDLEDCGAWRCTGRGLIPGERGGCDDGAHNGATDSHHGYRVGIGARSFSRGGSSRCHRSGGSLMWESAEIHNSFATAMASSLPR